MFYTSKLFFEGQKFKADVLNQRQHFVVNILIFLNIEKNLRKAVIMNKGKKKTLLPCSVSNKLRASIRISKS